jgi:photosystem II stability/assembly factor-like uncharacterized protein
MTKDSGRSAARRGAQTRHVWPGPAVGQLPVPDGGMGRGSSWTPTLVYRTTDQGRHWSAVEVPGTTPADTCPAPEVQALNATRAWLLDRGSSRIYATSDGGKIWRRIDTAALAAG